MRTDLICSSAERLKGDMICIEDMRGRAQCTPPSASDSRISSIESVFALFIMVRPLEMALVVTPRCSEPWCHKMAVKT